ncbi:Peptidoglycan/xylan/chitin deacetylase, PgdA/CDA1 family [Phyllobacterium sp. YR620]|uniref:polysaccharide deacetylase family protein n=1 Tax=Phyllobacterium sp. YR620 TaxID=1881066 RepID=UPI00087EB4E5|nr:polysaccharide deacetylase family protein [Phyllobacterium sp. YR620]SDP91098.1 Peptidoglycan/xylan/chitin deacetylase, PgdA/CDA1 family [Phyllobacterium sp. YR620]
MNSPFYRALLFAILLGPAPAMAADKTIYLTFDDGPLNGTSNILNVLDAEQVPAALFMVGLHAEASKERQALVAKAKSLPFVTIGNHSYSHAYNHYKYFYASVEGLLADLARANKVLGLKGPPIYARLPGRNVFRLPDMSSDDMAIGKPEDHREEPGFEFVAASGYYLYGWDHEWVHDDSGKPVQSVDHLVSEIEHLFAYGKLARPNKLILLMHDEMFQDSFNGTANLQSLIASLKKRSYKFGLISAFDD